MEHATRRDAVGLPVGYRLHPETHTPAYADASDEGLMRAPFAQHALWVTRSQDGELSAAGDHPNQGQIGDGLPSFAADHASVARAHAAQREATRGEVLASQTFTRFSAAGATRVPAPAAFDS